MDREERKAWQEATFEKYHTIFPPKNIRTDASKSCLAWGFEVGEGWYPIIEEVFKELTILGNGIQVEQVKEKFGGLRIYVDGVDSTVNKIIEMAEKKASVTCEACGVTKPAGPVRRNGWYYALCEKCLPENDDDLD